MTDPTPNNLPIPTPLSPAAKVLDAFLNNYTCRPSGNVAFETDRNGLAAALCAVADEVVPDIRAFISPGTAAGIRDDILAIATELRNHQ